jgi:hypothetical protein
MRMVKHYKQLKMQFAYHSTRNFHNSTTTSGVKAISYPDTNKSVDNVSKQSIQFFHMVLH